MFDKTKIVTWNNLQIPILPLKYTKELYESVNYKEKVELIEKHLSQ